MPDDLRQPPDGRLCPFCGGESGEHVTRFDCIHFVRCVQCKSSTGPHDTLTEAISAWNRRATLTINPEDAGQAERVARAWRKEEDRWGVRTGDEGGAEIYRHSRLGVVSPVVVATTTHKEARMLLDKMRDSAAARAALKALSDA